MKISIIVPVYNVEEYITECFNSIICQNYSGELECIFVDDCGQDDSVKILESLMEAYHGAISLRMLHHEKNKGLSCARNTGILNATGDYLYFMDSDDTISPNCMEKLGAMALKYPQVEMVQGSTEGSGEWLKMGGKNVPEYSDDFKWIRESILARFFIPMTAWNKLIRRDFVIKNQLLFEEGLIHEDELWSFMLAKYVKRIAFCTEITYFYRKNPLGITGTEKVRDYSPVVKKMVERVSGPQLYSEITCIWSISGDRYPDITSCLYKFRGVKFLVLMNNQLYPRIIQTTKYSFQGFFYRVVGILCRRILKFYINVAN